ncbi:MAG: endo-1,4-beta-xylanase [Chthoniobacterales bacterium]
MSSDTLQAKSSKPKAVPPRETTDTAAIEDDAIDARIKDLRTGQSAITVNGRDGEPLANTQVTLRQTNHAFNFGIVCFHYDLGRETAYNQRLTDVFNLAVHPFYWSGYEPMRGVKPYEKYHKDVAAALQHQGFSSKGHPLCWHSELPEWVNGSTEEVMELSLQRIRQMVSDHAGLVDVWDVCNEPVYSTCWDFESTPFSDMLQKVGAVDFLKRAHEVAREANPRAVLTINDYDTSDDGLDFFQACVDAGVDFDVVGLQSHMYSGEVPGGLNWELFTIYKGKAELWNSCERFSRFGKPIHFTELDIASGIEKTWPGSDYRSDWSSTAEGEQRQLEYAVSTYRLLFSHPSVDTITWWDFEDAGFLGAPIGLLHNDRTPKPAYHAIKQLIKETWWTGPMDTETDENGCVALDGYFGTYEVDCPMGVGSFTHRQGQESVDVLL